MKKFLLSVAVAAMAMSANAEGWFISGNFQGWNHCAEGFEFTETAEAGVFTWNAPEGMDLTTDFLIVQGEVGTPNWDSKIGSNGDAVTLSEEYYYAVGGGNFTLNEAVKNAKITLNTNDGYLIIEGEGQANEYDVVYMVGDMGTGWDGTTTAYPFALEEGSETVWAGTYTITGEANYFKFKAGTFEYGFVGEADAVVELGTPVTATKGGDKAFTLPAGDYTFKLDLPYNGDTATLTVTEATAINDVEADNEVAPVYYNLQGVRVDNAANGLYIVVRGDKAAKEYVR